MTWLCPTVCVLPIGKSAAAKLKQLYQLRRAKSFPTSRISAIFEGLSGPKDKAMRLVALEVND